MRAIDLGREVRSDKRNWWNGRPTVELPRASGALAMQRILPDSEVREGQMRLVARFLEERMLPTIRTVERIMRHQSR